MDKVDVQCAHCGNWPAYVGGNAVIKGVEATYLNAGERAHKNSPLHKAQSKAKPHIAESIVGSMSRNSDFDHGKGHNA
jgi:hypothetical protein